MLFERHGFLGGAATAGAVGQFVGWETRAGRRVIAGLAEEIVDRLARRVESKEQRDEGSERRPWQDAPMVWWMLGVLLGLLTLEWGWRKWLDLP